jgi:hypothetical protein
MVVRALRVNVAEVEANLAANFLEPSWDCISIDSLSPEPRPAAVK